MTTFGESAGTPIDAEARVSNRRDVVSEMATDNEW